MAFILDPALQEPSAEGRVESLPGRLLLLALRVPFGDAGGRTVGIVASVFVPAEIPGLFEWIGDELILLRWDCPFLCGRRSGDL